MADLPPSPLQKVSGPSGLPGYLPNYKKLLVNQGLASADKKTACLAPCLKAHTHLDNCLKNKQNEQKDSPKHADHIPFCNQLN